MSNHSEAFVAFDTSKLRNAVAIADAGRAGEVRFLGEIENSGAATAKLVQQAGRQVRAADVLLRGGADRLRAVPADQEPWSRVRGGCAVADSEEAWRSGEDQPARRAEPGQAAARRRADRGLGSRRASRGDARSDAGARERRSRICGASASRSRRSCCGTACTIRGKKTWTKAHMSWLASQKLEHPEQRIAFEEMLLAVRQAQERIERLEQAIRAAVPDWSLAEVVTALMAMRGIDLISATTFLAEIGDLSRFRTPRELMAYLGLVPSEDSTGDTVKRGPITKAGNRRARRILVECSWSYRHPPRVGKEKQEKVAAAPRAVREIAWKAQCRLSARYRALIRRGKLKTVAVTAVARELAGFIWAISREVTTARAAAK